MSCRVSFCFCRMQAFEDREGGHEKGGGGEEEEEEDDDDDDGDGDGDDKCGCDCGEAEKVKENVFWCVSFLAMAKVAEQNKFRVNPKESINPKQNTHNHNHNRIAPVMNNVWHNITIADSYSHCRHDILTSVCQW